MFDSEVFSVAHIVQNMVEAHGSFASAHCVKCHAEYDQDYVKQQIHTTTCCRCTACDGYDVQSSH